MNNKTLELYLSIGSTAKIVDWLKGLGCVTKDDVAQHLAIPAWNNRNLAIKHDAIHGKGNNNNNINSINKILTEFDD